MKKELNSDAYRYFAEAVRASPPPSQLPSALIADLKAEGNEDMAGRVQALRSALQDGSAETMGDAP